MPQPNDAPDPLIPGPPGGYPQLRFPKSGPPTDGNGNPVAQVGASVEIRRHDGTLRFGRPEDRGAAYFVYLADGQANFGDLNGDGHADYVVVMDDAVYLVNGKLKPGTYDVRKVGVRLRNVASNRITDLVAPVGDQNGDGADDVALGDRLYSGRALISHRKGTAVILPPPLRTVSHFIGALQLNASGPPTLVQGFGAIPEPSSIPNDPVELRIDDNNADCLVTQATATNPPAAGDTARVGGLDGWLVDGHRIVELLSDTRNSYVVYRWDLDA